MRMYVYGNEGARKGEEVHLIKKARDHWMKHKKATT